MIGLNGSFEFPAFEELLPLYYAVEGGFGNFVPAGVISGLQKNVTLLKEAMPVTAEYAMVECNTTLGAGRLLVAASVCNSTLGICFCFIQ
jgi:hypothetical protein